MEKYSYNNNRDSSVESSAAGQRKPKPAQRMPKAQAQALSRSLKKAVSVVSVLGFGAVSGLMAYHQVNAATTTTTTTTTQSSASSSQNNSSNSSFFKQQGESNVGSSSTPQSSSSTSSSNSNSGTSTASGSTTSPVTGTSVS